MPTVPQHYRRTDGRMDDLLQQYCAVHHQLNKNRMCECAKKIYVHQAHMQLIRQYSIKIGYLN